MQAGRYKVACQRLKELWRCGRDDTVVTGAHTHAHTHAAETLVRTCKQAAATGAWAYWTYSGDRCMVDGDCSAMAAVASSTSANSVDVVATPNAVNDSDSIDGSNDVDPVAAG